MMQMQQPMQMNPQSCGGTMIDRVFSGDGVDIEEYGGAKKSTKTSKASTKKTATTKKKVPKKKKSKK